MCELWFLVLESLRRLHLMASLILLSLQLPLGG